MSDIVAYCYQEFNSNERYMILRSDSTITTGGRFAYIQSKIPFGYEYLVDALNKAIDEEEKHMGKNAVTSEKIITEFEELNFDDLMSKFNTTIANIPGSSDLTGSSPEGQKFKEFYFPKITQIIERNLGKNKKIKDISFEQVEQLRLIVDELIEFVNSIN